MEDQAVEDVAMLHDWGMLLYNSIQEADGDAGGEAGVLNGSVFRGADGALIKEYTFEASDFWGTIRARKRLNKSLLIEQQQPDFNKFGKTEFSTKVTFQNVTVETANAGLTSSPERHEFYTFDGRPARKDFVILPSPGYEDLNYDLLAQVDTADLRRILCGDRVTINAERKAAIENLLGLLLCETGRRPTAALTFFMTLELIDLAEHHRRYDVFNLLRTRYGLQLGFQTDAAERAVIMKFFFVNLFPVSFKGAVNGCRYLDRIIREKSAEDGVEGLNYVYDNQEGQLGLEINARELLRREALLINIYRDVTNPRDTFQMYNEILRRWAGGDMNYRRIEVLRKAIGRIGLYTTIRFKTPEAAV